MEQFVDIYTEAALPLWAVLFVQTTALPFVQSLITQAKMSGGRSRVTTIILSVVAGLLMTALDGSVSVAEVLQLAAPGVIITSGSYALAWKALGIRNWLLPEAGAA